MRLRLVTAALLVCTALSAQTRGDVARLDSLINASPEQRRELTLKKSAILKRMYCFDEAAEALASLLEAGRMDAEVLGEIADSHYQAGNFEDAAQMYGLLSQMQPDNLGFRVRLMNLASRAKAYSDVLAEGREVLRRDTLQPVLTLMADAFQKTEQPDSALVYYRNALRRKPRNASVVGKIADILLGRKAYDETLALVGDYLSMDPDNMTIAPLQGLAYYLKGDYETAGKVFQRQEDIGNDAYSIHYYLGNSYWRTKVIYRAEQELIKAWQIDSSDVSLAYNIAAVKIDAIRPFEQDIKPWLDKALAMMEPDPALMSRIHQQYGLGYYRMTNSWDRAIEHYKEAYRYNPNLISALSTIAYCYQMKKEYKVAIEWYEKYLKVARPGSRGYEFAADNLKYLRSELFMEEP